MVSEKSRLNELSGAKASGGTSGAAGIANELFGAEGVDDVRDEKAGGRIIS